MDVMGNMPGDAEANGAADGMREVYGKPETEHAVGDTISWRDDDGAIRTGRIDAISGDVHLVIQADGGYRAVSASQIARV